MRFALGGNQEADFATNVINKLYVQRIVLVKSKIIEKQIFYQHYCASVITSLRI